MHDNAKRDSRSSFVSTDPKHRVLSLFFGFVPLVSGSLAGAAQASSWDRHRFHNATLTRSAINESLETRRYKNATILWGLYAYVWHGVTRNRLPSSRGPLNFEKRRERKNKIAYRTEGCFLIYNNINLT